MRLYQRFRSTEAIMLVFIVIAVLYYFLPFYRFTGETSTMLTVSTFLFGIFAGFVIASRMSRYSRYRELLTNETGSLISFYEYSCFVSDKFSSKIADLIDKYLIESFLYEVTEYHDKTEKQFYDIINALKFQEATTPSEERALNYMKDLIKDFFRDREELYLLGKDKLSFWLKTTLLILSGIIIYSLALARTPSLYSYVITVLLSGSTFIVLSIIRDLDKLRTSSNAISYGIYYRVFDALDKPRLYTNETISRNIKPFKNMLYRSAEIIRDKNKRPRYSKIVLKGSKKT